MQKQTRDLLLMLFIGFLIGILAVMIWNSHRGERNANTELLMSSETAKGSAATGTSSRASFSSSNVFPLLTEIPANTRTGLSVLDQKKGAAVQVGNLSIVGTKWVAIYDDHEGRPGWILGAARVREGDKETSVSLLRPEGTISGATYYAAILNDDGEGEFNRLTDLPPLSPEKVIIVRFTVQ